jgi:hypothetical protein
MGERIAGATRSLIDPKRPWRDFGSTPTPSATRVYNEVDANIPKVPKAEFDSVLTALLKAPATPLSAIESKRKPKKHAMPGPKKSPVKL